MGSQRVKVIDIITTSPPPKMSRQNMRGKNEQGITSYKVQIMREVWTASKNHAVISGQDKY